MFQHCLELTVVSCLVVPKMRKSSIMQSTPGKPSRSECILHSLLKVL